MNTDKNIILENAKESLSKQGLSVAKFAKKNNVSATLVQAILKGKSQCRIGKSHNIGVLLGIKEGEIVD
jgi:gp16 family phage-associated protein